MPAENSRAVTSKGRAVREPACGNCNGSGWVVLVEEGVEKVKICPLCRGPEEVRARLELAAIPPRYVDRGFDLYSFHNKSQEHSLKRSIQYVDQFPDVPRGLLFVGPCGVGKTHLSVAILKTLIEEKQLSGRFVDETELLRRLQYSYGPDSMETEREVLLPLMRVDLLVWDDLGTGRPTEWVAETIRTVLNYRYTYEKQTILSTNWPLEQLSSSRGSRGSEPFLAERIGHRLFSRILEMCEVLEIEGPDARAEIHKARLDFQDAQQKSPIPEDLLVCPNCSSKNVDLRDTSSRKQKPGSEAWFDLSCNCAQCGTHFLARYFSQSRKVDYPG